jgi:phospholipid/cholesterol/gamma-HCH transport system ATP-binding protein
LFDSLSVLENVAFPLRETTSLQENEIRERACSFLEHVGLKQAKDLYPDEISGGMQKRLGIARALALNPEIVFYDDPTAGLDPITSKRIMDLIINLKKESNATIVTITNDMNRAFQLADRIAMVVETEIIETGTVDDTRASTDIRVLQFIHGLLQGPLTVMG